MAVWSLLEGFLSLAFNSRLFLSLPELPTLAASLTLPAFSPDCSILSEPPVPESEPEDDLLWSGSECLEDLELD